MSMELTLLETTMGMRHCSSSELTCTSTRLTPINMCPVLSWWTWNLARWTVYGQAK
ncbi:hypothetical protein Q9233_011288 [Columba guinea]|nr:hypothetical protein Q9233_011288 [Columba guinea]